MNDLNRPENITEMEIVAKDFLFFSQIHRA